jgi:hypothetical protein
MISEAATAMFLAVQQMAAFLVLSQVAPESAEIMQWTLLPMIGATLAATGAFCFNTQLEVRKIVVGRCLFALVVGILGPRLMSMSHPWLKSLLVDPLILVGAGFIHGFAAYLMSWPFVRKAYERAPVIADKQMQAVEKEIDRRIKQNNPTTQLEP